MVRAYSNHYKPIEVGLTTVYLHSNMKEEPREHEDDLPVYSYDEVTIPKDDYIAQMAESLLALEELEVERQYNDVLNEWLADGLA